MRSNILVGLQSHVALRECRTMTIVCPKGASQLGPWEIHREGCKCLGPACTFRVDPSRCVEQCLHSERNPHRTSLPIQCKLLAQRVIKYTLFTPFGVRDRDDNLSPELRSEQLVAS